MASALPLKPDIVMEGGNAAEDGLGAVTMPSLRLLITNYFARNPGPTFHNDQRYERGFGTSCKNER